MHAFGYIFFELILKDCSVWMHNGAQDWSFWWCDACVTQPIFFTQEDSKKKRLYFPPFLIQGSYYTFTYIKLSSYILLLSSMSHIVYLANQCRNPDWCVYYNARLNVNKFTYACHNVAVNWATVLEYIIKLSVSHFIFSGK